MKCEYCKKEIEESYTIKTYTHTSEGPKDKSEKYYCNIECCNSAILARKYEKQKW